MNTCHPCRLILALFFASSLACAGCSKSGPELVTVHGTITYQGQPVEQGTVLFMPKNASDRSQRVGSAPIGAGGAYSIRSIPGREGIPPGDYNVCVQSYTGSHLDGSVKYLVPAKFGEPATSGLAVTVAAGAGSIEKDFAIAAPAGK